MTVDNGAAKPVSLAEKKLGLSFDNKSLLRQALTHSSFAFENGTDEFNEKLEFLGDSVLGLAVTDEIYHRFPQYDEGVLAKMRANLVKTDTLARLARGLELGECLLIGRGSEQSGGRENTSILADSYEAVLGAIYLDLGYDRVRDFILSALEKEIEIQGHSDELADPKTVLQELTMERWQELPEYSIVNREGPAHRPVFVAEVAVRGRVRGQGEGSSKKKAEQLAAKEALKAISG